METRKIHVCGPCKESLRQNLPVSGRGRNLYYEEWLEDQGTPDKRPICDACNSRCNQPLQEVDEPSWRYRPGQSHCN